MRLIVFLSLMIPHIAILLLSESNSDLIIERRQFLLPEAGESVLWGAWPLAPHRVVLLVAHLRTDSIRYAAVGLRHRRIC